MTAILSYPIAAYAIQTEVPTAGDPVDRVISRVLESPELPTMAAGLLDSIGGRLSGTLAGSRAERWAADWLRNFDFDSVWLEEVRIPVWHRGELSVKVQTPAALRNRNIVALAYGYSPAVEAASAPVIDIGRGDLEILAAAAEGAQGAAVLTDVVSAELIDAAAKAGAVALLRSSMEPGRLPQARVAPAAEVPAPLPVISLAHEDGAWLRRVQLAGSVTLRLSSSSETTPGFAANVVGELRGSDPSVRDEVVVMGAHLDAWDVGDGALDNGTGVLAAMAAAAGLADSGARPRRTIRVVLFAGEELGLLGSRAYVERHADSLSELVGVLNMDMVGIAEGFGATGHPEADTLFVRLARLGALRGMGLSHEVEHGGGPGSDHQPFLLAGVPTIYVRTSLPPDAVRWYHNAGDTFEKVDLDAVRGSAAAAAAMIWELADHPGRPLVHLTPEETGELVRRLGWVNR